MTHFVISESGFSFYFDESVQVGSDTLDSRESRDLMIFFSLLQQITIPAVAVNQPHIASHTSGARACVCRVAHISFFTEQRGHIVLNVSQQEDSNNFAGLSIWHRYRHCTHM